MKLKAFLTNKKTWTFSIFFLLLVAGFSYYRMQSNSQEDSFRELKVEKGDLGVTVLATGTVLPQNRLEIKAPITGMLILRSVEPGQTFTNADAIFTMSDRLTVKAQVDETDISKIRNREPAEIVLDAYPNQRIAAVVDQIAYDAKTVNSVTTYIVDVLPKEAPEYMRSGMTANVTFFIESRKQILLVPNESIKVQDGKTIVNLRLSAGKSSTQEVQLGISDGKRTEVLAGLSEGDVVLVKDVKLGADRKKSNNPFSPMGGARAPRR